MRTSRAWVLLAVLVVGAYALLELPRRRAQDRSDEHARSLVHGDLAAADSIVMVRGPERIELVRRATGWETLVPVRDRADLSAVVTLIDALENTDVVRTLGPVEDTRAFSLDPPEVALRVFAGGVSLVHLDIGAFTAGREYVYARRSDGEVLLLTTSVRRTVTIPAGDFRDRRVLRFDLAEVRAYEILAPGHAPMRWVQAGTRWTTVAGGDTIPGDSVAVPSVLRRLRGFRVRAFVDSAGATADWTTAGSLAVTIERHPPAPTITAHFLERPGAFWARVDGNDRVITLEGDVASIARETVASLRDRRVLQFDPGAATRISVSAPDTSAVIVRAGERWSRVNPALPPLRPEHAEALVRGLRTLCFDAVTREGAPPESPPLYAADIQGGAGAVLDRFEARAVTGNDSTLTVTSVSMRALRATISRRALDEIVRRLRTLGAPQ